MLFLLCICFLFISKWNESIEWNGFALIHSLLVFILFSFSKTIQMNSNNKKMNSQERVIGLFGRVIVCI